MSLHTVANSSCNLSEAMGSQHHLGKNVWTMFLIQITEGISYMHGREILHNDIKGSNILLSQSYTGDNSIKAVVSDFGKACHIKRAKTFKLPSEEKEKHRKKHPQIAPDLIDSLATQNYKSDVYSLGRIIHEVKKAKLTNGVLNKKLEACLECHEKRHPDTSHIMQKLSEEVACYNDTFQ